MDDFTRIEGARRGGGKKTEEEADLPLSVAFTVFTSLVARSIAFDPKNNLEIEQKKGKSFRLGRREEGG